MRARCLLAGLALSAQGLALAACDGRTVEEAGPMSEDEEQALSQAAQMLDDPRENPRDQGSPANTIESDEREGF